MKTARPLFRHGLRPAMVRERSEPYPRGEILQLDYGMAPMDKTRVEGSTLAFPVTTRHERPGSPARRRRLPRPVLSQENDTTCQRTCRTTAPTGTKIQQDVQTTNRQVAQQLPQTSTSSTRQATDSGHHDGLHEHRSSGRFRHTDHVLQSISPHHTTNTTIIPQGTPTLNERI